LESSLLDMAKEVSQIIKVQNTYLRKYPLWYNI
jgi:hypothetical protein